MAKQTPFEDKSAQIANNGASLKAPLAATQINSKGEPATKDDVRLIHLVMTGVVIGLFAIAVGSAIAYIPVILDSLAEKKDGYNSLRDKIDAQDKEINQLNIDIELLKAADKSEPGVPATPAPAGS